MVKKFYLKPKQNTKFNLNLETINKYKINLILENDKLYLNGNYQFKTFDKLNIPRQYISEVLNEHMDTNFQDFINKYQLKNL
jgi:hypothetical protein